MSSLGKQTHLNRLMSHASGRMLTVAVDHLINYPTGLPDGLRDLERTIAFVAEGEPSAITLNKGTAVRFMPLYAGRIPFIIQQSVLRAGQGRFGSVCSVEEAVALGADGIAVAMFVHCEEEIDHVKQLAAIVRESERFGLPVIPHIYPLSSGDEKQTVVHEPEAIFYAARIGLEEGADIIKVPYTGAVSSYRDIVRAMPVPVVAAGGPRCETLEQAVAMVSDVVSAGAAGATVGRNVWAFDNPAIAVRRLKEAALGT